MPQDVRSYMPSPKLLRVCSSGGAATRACATLYLYLYLYTQMLVAQELTGIGILEPVSPTSRMDSDSDNFYK